MGLAASTSTAAAGSMVRAPQGYDAGVGGVGLGENLGNLSLGGCERGEVKKKEGEITSSSSGAPSALGLVAVTLTVRDRACTSTRPSTLVGPTIRAQTATAGDLCRRLQPSSSKRWDSHEATRLCEWSSESWRGLATVFPALCGAL